MSRSLSQTALAGVLALAAAFPAAAQQLTVKTEPQAGGAGVALKAMQSKTQVGNMVVNCDTTPGFASFYKTGNPTAIKIQGGEAREMTIASDSPVFESKPIPMPPDLDPAKLCVAGRPDVPAAKAALLARLAKD